MKNFKRIIAGAALIATLAMGLVSCGGNNKNMTDGTTTTTAKTTVTTKADTTTTTERGTSVSGTTTAK